MRTVHLEENVLTHGKQNPFTSTRAIARNMGTDHMNDIWMICPFLYVHRRNVNFFVHSIKISLVCIRKFFCISTYKGLWGMSTSLFICIHDNSAPFLQCVLNLNHRTSLWDDIWPHDLPLFDLLIADWYFSPPTSFLPC